MLSVSILWLLAVAAAIALEAFARPEERPVPVRIVRQDGGFHLERGGSRYFIRGVGGADHLELLARLGGNSIRTWDAADKGNLLAVALRHDLTVTLGLWVGHTRHGFNYDDEQAVAAQQKALLEQVRRYKDHPAVLMWCVGNEMDGPWQMGHLKAHEYGAKAREAAKLMRWMDPSIQTILCGSSNDQMPTYPEWDRVTLEQCWEQVDYLSMHYYAGNADGDTAVIVNTGGLGSDRQRVQRRLGDRGRRRVRRR